MVEIDPLRFVLAVLMPRPARAGSEPAKAR